MPNLRILSLVVMLSVVFLTGCDEQVVYKRPVAELNQKAAQLMEMGDYDGAVSRLESSLDLMPNEPTTMYNLAIAYQYNEQHEKSLQIFQQLVEKKQGNEAELLRSIAIVNETMADTLMQKVLEAEDFIPTPAEKLSADEISTMRTQAVDHYKVAIQHYEEALPGLKGNEQPVQAQITALTERIDSIESPKKN